VRLPCRPLNTDDIQCAINALEDDFKECVEACVTSDPGTATVSCGTIVEAGTCIATSTPTLINNVNALFTDCSSTIDDIESAVADAIVLATRINTAVNTYNGDCNLERFSLILGELLVSLNDFANSLQQKQNVFENQKFCISSGASGHEREVITFDVSPLAQNVVSSGIFTKCYSYEVTRVPCRVVDESAVEHCKRKSGIDYVIDSNECCKVCNVVVPYLVPDTLRLMFPMTKEIKCLVPDFNLPGSLANAAFGTIATKVRLVACTPCKFYIPAKLTFDKEKCMACLEVSTQYIMSEESRKDMEGYEHRFGCECGKRHGKCCCDVTDLRGALLSIQQKFVDVCIDVTQDGPGDIALWTALGNVMFQTLARAKNIDVMGVNKCVEKDLYTFQVCYVPYRGFCADLCGCKAKTETVDFGHVDVGDDDYTLNPCNSYKVQANCEYSYEFLKLSSGYVDDPELDCP